MIGNAVIHPVEVTHDKQLLILLLARAQAENTVAVMERRLLNAASQSYVDYRGQAQIREDYRVKYVKLTDLPIGTLYYQAKGYGRNSPQGYFVLTGVENGWPRQRPATVADALAILTPDQHGAFLGDYRSALSAYNAAIEAVYTHEANYTGWSRFFLVTSSAGHVHSSMHCTTCYPTTTYAPVVELSGCSEAEAVALLGTTLCSRCFPSAIEGKPTKLTKAQANKLVGLS